MHNKGVKILISLYNFLVSMGSLNCVCFHFHSFTDKTDFDALNQQPTIYWECATTWLP